MITIMGSLGHLIFNSSKVILHYIIKIKKGLTMGKMDKSSTKIRGYRKTTAEFVKFY